MSIFFDSIEYEGIEFASAFEAALERADDERKREKEDGPPPEPPDPED
jgi:hypothetical protein